MTCESSEEPEIAITARVCILYGDFSGRSDTRFRPCRFYGIDTSTGLVVPPIPLAFNTFTR